MIIKGRALKIARKQVVSPCGFDGLAGYKDDGSAIWLSFMPKTAKVTTKVTTLTVEGKQAKVIKHVPSKYVVGMWTFFIKYED